ncbi:hypothetical protein GCM10007242_03090 [Pigmentiphaga litoralis]|nr:hypothetical protein GCM10007242_03090 [Pigmentiphaga litoralis]
MAAAWLLAVERDGGEEWRSEWRSGMRWRVLCQHDGAHIGQTKKREAADSFPFSTECGAGDEARTRKCYPPWLGIQLDIARSDDGTPFLGVFLY